MKIILIISAVAAAGAIFMHRQAIMEYCGIAQTTDNVQIQRAYLPSHSTSEERYAFATKPIKPIIYNKTPLEQGKEYPTLVNVYTNGLSSYTNGQASQAAS